VKLTEPKRDQILRFCSRDPVERVFLEDVARRGLGRFVARADGGELLALCHMGVNVVPSGDGCGAFARDVARAAPRMLIGEERAVSELWEEVRSRLPSPRENRPGQPVFVIRTPPTSGETGLREARREDLRPPMPAGAGAVFYFDLRGGDGRSQALRSDGLGHRDKGHRRGIVAGPQAGGLDTGEDGDPGTLEPGDVAVGQAWVIRWGHHRTLTCGGGSWGSPGRPRRRSWRSS